MTFQRLVLMQLNNTLNIVKLHNKTVKYVHIYLCIGVKIRVDLNRQKRKVIWQLSIIITSWWLSCRAVASKLKLRVCHSCCKSHFFMFHWKTGLARENSKEKQSECCSVEGSDQEVTCNATHPYKQDNNGQRGIAKVKHPREPWIWFAFKYNLHWQFFHCNSVFRSIK